MLVRFLAPTFLPVKTLNSEKWIKFRQPQNIILFGSVHFLTALLQSILKGSWLWPLLCVNKRQNKWKSILSFNNRSHRMLHVYLALQSPVITTVSSILILEHEFGTFRIKVELKVLGLVITRIRKWNILTHFH